MSVALDRRTGRWVVRWRDGSVHRSRSFTLKRDAEHFDRERRRARELGGLFEPDRAVKTLSEVVELWWADYVLPCLEQATRDGYMVVWGRHLRPALGALPLHELTPGRVDAHRAELESAGVGRPTIAKALAILSGICRFAVLRGLIDANPVREIRKPTIRRQRFVAPAAPSTVERLRRELLRAERLEDAALVSVLAYAGLRPGEALALRWGDVGTRSLRIERAAANGVTKATKNERLRTVRLIAPLAFDLAWWRAITPWRDADGYLFPDGLGHVRNGFAWKNWRTRVFKPAVSASGAVLSRPYDLRHSFASLLIHEGRSLTELAAQLGDSVTVAADVYAHAFAEVEEMPREPASEAIERAREATGVRQMYVELGLFDAASALKAAEEEEADARTRTADPFITSEVLYQLSYVGEAGQV